MNQVRVIHTSRPLWRLLQASAANKLCSVVTHSCPSHLHWLWPRRNISAAWIASPEKWRFLKDAWLNRWMGRLRRQTCQTMYCYWMIWTLSNNTRTKCCRVNLLPYLAPPWRPLKLYRIPFLRGAQWFKESSPNFDHFKGGGKQVVFNLSCVLNHLTGELFGCHKLDPAT